MHVENVLLDEVSIGEFGESAEITSVLHQFGTRRWVSAHRSSGRALGPLTIVDEDAAVVDSPIGQVTNFGARDLVTHDGSFSYEEVWTIPPWTVYALLLPSGCVATQLDILSGESAESNIGFNRRVTHDQRIFYYAAIGGGAEQRLVTIRARIEEDPGQWERDVEAAGYVEGPKNFPAVRNTAGAIFRSPDLWLRILELGGKLNGL